MNRAPQPASSIDGASSKSLDKGEPTVAVVLAGGGARGAYEAGALSVLLPVLEEDFHQRVRIIVGTSVGAFNGTWLAATAHLPVRERVAQLKQLWTELTFKDVLRPLVSGAELARIAELGGQFLGLPRCSASALLDPAPLAATMSNWFDLRRVAENIESGRIDALAVVATCLATQESVVFHQGGRCSPRRDRNRGICYVSTRLTMEHVLASAAIPILFPAVRVVTEHACTWFVDGGTRLNTPTKPALALGATHILAVGLNSTSTGPAQSSARPDLFEGAAQILQALLADPLAHDMRTLATINALVGGRGETRGGQRHVPFVYVAPERREAIGRIAQRAYRERYAGAAGAVLGPLDDLWLLGRMLSAERSAIHGDLLSYVFFAPEFTQALIAQGESDARRWLEAHPEFWQ